MWPGDQQSGGQSGGQQNPSGNPPQQPPGPYGPPSPYGQPGYQQPGYPQQPGQQQPGPYQGQQPGQHPGQQQPYPPTASPYAQPGYHQPAPPPGYPTPQSWGPPAPGGPEGPPPPGGRGKLNVGIAIVAAVAVIAAVAVGVVYFTGGKKDKDAGKDITPTATAPKSPTATATTPTPTPTGTQDQSTTGGDDPRGPAGANDVDPVVPGWQVVKRTERNVAFDVPADWKVDSETMSVGFEDNKGKPVVFLTAPGYYQQDVCKTGSNSVDGAVAGTKGGAGATSIQSAAETEAQSWAYWAFQENGKGTVSKAKSRKFSNSYGIDGWAAQATMSHVPKATKCSSDGIAYTVAWLDPSQQKPTPVVFVLFARQGVPGQLGPSVVDKIESSIRPIKK